MFYFPSSFFVFLFTRGSTIITVTIHTRARINIDQTRVRHNVYFKIFQRRKIYPAASTNIKNRHWLNGLWLLSRVTVFLGLSLRAHYISAIRFPFMFYL